MKLDFYSYANIVRILYVDEVDFSQSLMIDVDIDHEKILSIFDASKKFDSDFIKSFINILRVSTTGFERISDKATSDRQLIDKAIQAAKESENTSAKELRKRSFMAEFLGHSDFSIHSNTIINQRPKDSAEYDD